MLGISNAPLSYTYLVLCLAASLGKNANANGQREERETATDGRVVFDMIAKYCIQLTNGEPTSSPAMETHIYIYLPIAETG